MINCEFESGKQASLRHTVVGTIITRDDQVLLVRRAPTLRVDAGRLAIPGGFMDHDETLVEAARREAKEETGYEITIDGLFTINDQPEPRNDQQNVVCYFLARPTTNKPTANHDHETSELIWISLDELPDEDEMAFNHRQILERYRAHRAHPMPIPYLNGLPE